MNLYHRIQKDFIGDRILPLNQLRSFSPLLAEKYFSKYTDRPSLPERPVESLNCGWNDVIHLSPIHPAKVRTALEEVGYNSLQPAKYFVIPFSKLDKEKVGYVVSALDKENPVQADMPDDFTEQMDVPASVKQYYRNEYERGEFPLLYAGTQHVLYHGSIPIEGLEIISA